MRTHVLVIGAGFAGCMAAVRLAGRARGRVAATVVNPRPAFVNRLRLHRAAVGQPLPSLDLRALLGADVTFVEGHVTELDVDAGRATVVGPHPGTRHLRFDRAVLATGSMTEPVPVPGGEHTYAVGDRDAAERLRRSLRTVPDGAAITVVGGGFTGIETVAELAEARPDVTVRLVTAGEVAGWFSPKAGEHVRRALTRLGVDAIGGVRVRAVERDRLLLDDGAEVPSDVTVWCGGFAAAPLARQAGIVVDAQGAVVTDAALQSVSHPQLVAVGDAAHTPNPAGERYSMSCQFAFPSAAHAADVVRDEALGVSGGGAPAAFGLGFVGRCVSLGGRDGVLQMTTRTDVATDRAIGGRPAAAIKRFQLWGVERTAGWERRVPGAVRWPGPGRRVPREALLDDRMAG